MSSTARQHSLPRLLDSTGFSISCGVLLAALWALFTYAHLVAFVRLGEPRLLLLVVAETLTAGFYLLRSKPKSVSIIPFDWFVAFAGTFLPLFLRPAEGGLLPLAGNLMIVGLALQILSVASLNRSFALVAANRSIKTHWMYSLVRHPIYASYVLTFTGYALANTSLWNVMTYAGSIALLIIRIFREERHLSTDASYGRYMREVPYRLIPFVF